MSDYYPEKFDKPEKTIEYLLRCRIAELEAQVEALAPKPEVVSVWANFYQHGLGDWASTLEDSLEGADGAKSFIARLRKDTIIHPCGKVEYKLEVEG